MEVFWRVIEEFPNYSISNLGDVVNETTGTLLRQSRNQEGIVKVNLIQDGVKYSRSVKVLVAVAFVECHYDMYKVPFDTPIQLDGNQLNVQCDNLMWRPRWFAWKYARQFYDVSELHHRGPIRDIKTRDQYLHIYEAGVINGILFKDVWRSINLINPAAPTFPTGQIFEFIR